MMQVLRYNAISVIAMRMDHVHRGSRLTITSMHSLTVWALRRQYREHSAWKSHERVPDVCSSIL